MYERQCSGVLHGLAETVVIRAQSGAVDGVAASAGCAVGWCGPRQRAGRRGALGFLVHKAAHCATQARGCVSGVTACFASRVCESGLVDGAACGHAGGQGVVGGNTPIGEAEVCLGQSCIHADGFQHILAVVGAAGLGDIGAFAAGKTAGGDDPRGPARCVVAVVGLGLRGQAGAQGFRRDACSCGLTGLQAVVAGQPAAVFVIDQRGAVDGDQVRITNIFAVEGGKAGGAHDLSVDQVCCVDRQRGGGCAVAVVHLVAGAGGGAQDFRRDGVFGTRISDAIAHLGGERAARYSVSAQHILATGPGQRAC